MIDLHSHILFNLDDGIKTKEKMFESIKFLSSLGYMEIIPTPHKYHILFNPKLEDVKERISYIKSSMIKRFSFEYAFSTVLADKNNNEIVPLYVSPSGWKVIMIEFLPFMYRKNAIEKAVYLLNSKGISPLIAHIERYGMTEKFWVELKEKYSVFLQVGLKTFAKTFFDAKKKHAIKLLELGIIDNASTDLHSTEQFKLVEKGLDFILKKFPNLKEQLFSISFES